MAWRRASFALLLAGSLSSGNEVPNLMHEFELFANDFGREYKGLREREARFVAFVKNYLYILAENAKGHSYTLGLTQFADMLPEEFAKTHTGLLAHRSPWKGLPRLGAHAPSNTTLPTSIDWREKGAVTPVKNQAQCGACWAFSTTGALEGAWAKATGKLVSLSEQQLVDCSSAFGNQGCSGGDMDGAFKYAEGVAVCTEESYPYKAASSSCRAPNCTVAIPKGSIKGFRDVAADDMQALMDAVAQQPVSVAIEADQMAFQLYRGGVLTAECGDKLDHGVLLVGYGTQDGQDYWIIKNSWGPSWGLNGYALLARGKAGSGECGIKAMPSYPVVEAALAPISV